MEGRFSILHSLDGYDEISLTGPFKMISNQGEKLLSPENLGLFKLSPESIGGGSTVQESAKIFENVLKGDGTESQNAVVTANAAAAFTKDACPTMLSGEGRSYRWPEASTLRR